MPKIIETHIVKVIVENVMRFFGGHSVVCASCQARDD